MSLQNLIDPTRPLILDGGLGSELAARGCDISSSLWSAELIQSRPDELTAVHRAYLDAGADCITTASYQASEPGLRARGLDPGQIDAFFTRSIELARAARDRYSTGRDAGQRPLVAASVGPYGAYLADGSEYRGNYGLDDAELREFHAARLASLDRGGADLLAVETIPDLQEARVLAELLERVETPAWISFCCRDAQHLHDGNRLVAAAELFNAHPRVFAVGVNCCAAEIVEDAIAELREVVDQKMIVVYPNSGGQYDAATKSWHGAESPRNWSALARRWYRAGAGMIGGCCRVGPAYIRQMASETSWHC